MQEVVDVPGLVADPQVVVLLGHEVVEHHEVRDQDLVHRPDRLEGVQVVLAGEALDVAAHLARYDDAGCTRSPWLSRKVITGSWVSQSTWTSGRRARNSCTIARSRRAWPRPIGEDR